MHFHICPVEITAALMLFQNGVPYVKATWCHHTSKIKEKYNEWKGIENASEDELERQEVEEIVSVSNVGAEGKSSGCVHSKPRQSRKSSCCPDEGNR